ncbi:hypothetical protein L7F22_016379 [Adiantum nelumboides]|nr:hypothetical protein [Adiantum nelumboides]
MMLASASQDGTVRLWRLQATDEGSEAIRPEVPRPDQDEFDRLASEIEGTQRQEGPRRGQHHNPRTDVLLWRQQAMASKAGRSPLWARGVGYWPPMGTARLRQARTSSSTVDIQCRQFCYPVGTFLVPLFFFFLFYFGHFPSFEEAELDTKATKDDIWVAAHRFGELGGTGSAANGMYGAAWKPQATSENPAVMAHGYGGAIHIWSKEKGGPVSDWQPRPAKGGHFASASSVRWEPRGDYLISGGLDKTTRLHGRFRERLPNPMLSTSKQHGSQRRDDENAKEQSSWHEIARPQTHGYEIVGLSWLSRLMFASAGGEKIVRVFEAPKDSLIAPSIWPPCPLPSEVKEQRAWGVAVQRQRLQTDVDVLCVADEFAQACLDDKISGGISSVWLVDEPSSLPPASVLDTTKISRERVHGILPSSSPFPAPIHEDSASLPQHRNIAMGGTFDHLHAGHKILLSMAAMTATERIIAAVTDDSMLTKKKYAEILESLDERTRRVDAFLELFGRAYNPSGAVKRDVSKLTDVAGPAGTEEDLQAIILTDETVSGGDYIDKVRAEKGLKALSRLSIGVLGSGGETEVKGKDAAELAAAKVGSSYIREWLAKKGQTEKENAGKDEDDFDGSKRTRRPVGASVPPLGLSNRAVYDSGALLEDEPPSESGQAVGKSQRSISLELSKPPTEETLHLSSLWSEVEKVYGHSLELLSIDAADGLIATSANARTEEQAAVRIFDTTQRFKEVQVLTGHQLGATSVRFSLGNPAGRNLLTASRDRSWRLYERTQEMIKGRSISWCRLAQHHTEVVNELAWQPWRHGNSSRARCSRVLAQMGPCASFALNRH